MPAMMKANGIAIVNETDPLSFNTGDLDVSAQVTKMKSLNPDGVVLSADYSQAVTVLREMKRQGFIKPVVGATQLDLFGDPESGPGTADCRARYLLRVDDGRSRGPLRRGTATDAAQGIRVPAEIEPSMYDANIYEIVSMYVEAAKNPA